jgi:hypothetical protein
MLLQNLSATLLALPRNSKRLVVMALDLVLALATVWLAFYLRIDQFGLPERNQVFVYALAIVGCIAPYFAIPAWRLC